MVQLNQIFMAAGVKKMILKITALLLMAAKQFQCLVAGVVRTAVLLVTA